MVQWLGFGTFTAGTWVQSLVRDLRSCKPRVQPKRKGGLEFAVRFGNENGIGG